MRIEFARGLATRQGAWRTPERGGPGLQGRPPRGPRSLSERELTAGDAHASRLTPDRALLAWRAKKSSITRGSSFGGASRGAPGGRDLAHPRRGARGLGPGARDRRVRSEVGSTPTRATGVEAGKGTRGESEHGQQHERGSASLPATKPVGGCEELSGSRPAPRESGFRTGGCGLGVRRASGPSGLRLRDGSRTHPFRPCLRAAPGTPPRRIGTQTGSGCLLPYCSGEVPGPLGPKGWGSYAACPKQERGGRVGSAVAEIPAVLRLAEGDLPVSCTPETCGTPLAVKDLWTLRDPRRSGSGASSGAE